MSDRVKREFGSRVRTLRKAAGLSTGQFASMIGISKPFLIQIEHGTRNPSLGVIERIADGFDMSMSELLRGIGEKKKHR